MDVDMLLPPLVALPPCGEDMAFSREFDDIAEVRRAEGPHGLAEGLKVCAALCECHWPDLPDLPPRAHRGTAPDTSTSTSALASTSASGPASPACHDATP